MLPGRYYVTDSIHYPALVIRGLQHPGVLVMYFTEASTPRIAARRGDTPGAGVFVEGLAEAGEAPPPPAPNWSMDNTKAELKAAAESMGISVPSSWSKATILAAINAA